MENVPRPAGTISGTLATITDTAVGNASGENPVWPAARPTGGGLIAAHCGTSLITPAIPSSATGAGGEKKDSSAPEFLISRVPGTTGGENPPSAIGDSCAATPVRRPGMGMSKSIALACALGARDARDSVFERAVRNSDWSNPSNTPEAEGEILSMQAQGNSH